jgi:small nuclear ribonucleoprotein (snRNP)-like protein
MKNILTLFLIVLLLTGSNALAQSIGQSTDGSKIQSKVKQYSDSKKRVVVTTISGDKVKGHIASFDQEKFTVVDSKSSQTREFRYTEVRNISKSGGLSTGAIVAIAAAGVGATILLVTLGKYCRNEGGC